MLSFVTAAWSARISHSGQIAFSCILPISAAGSLCGSPPLRERLQQQLRAVIRALQGAACSLRKCLYEGEQLIDILFSCLFFNAAGNVNQLGAEIADNLPDIFRGNAACKPEP